MTSGQRIGILGGSFNPAHLGHLHISEIARKKLGLSQVWWVVSPQNPLKPTKGMMDFEKRIDSAKQISKSHAKIHVSDIEQKLGTRYTIDTLKRLKQKYPHIEFYFIMGADNLIQLTRWKKWQEIFKYAQVHVFDRDSLAYLAVKSRAAVTNKIHYHRIMLCNESSTRIRNSVKD
jgi:nicotinate-nucleotide adenylyltransferase